MHPGGGQRLVARADHAHLLFFQLHMMGEKGDGRGNGSSQRGTGDDTEADEKTAWPHVPLAAGSARAPRFERWRGGNSAKFSHSSLPQATMARYGFGNSQPVLESSSPARSAGQAFAGIFDALPGGN